MTVRQFMGVLTVGAALAGCAGIGDAFKEPEFRLDRAIVRGVGLTGGSLDLVVDVYNPNHFDLRGVKLQVGFDVEGSHLGDILYDDEYRVEQGDTTTVTLPLQFNWSGVGGAVRAALGYGDLPYTMKGQATLDTPVGRRVVPFTREGRVPLTRSGGLVPIPGGGP